MNAVPVDVAGRPSPGARAARVAPARRSRAPGDLHVEALGRVGHISWTICFVGFLLYIYVVTTYQLPLGDVAVAVALVGLLIQRGSIQVPQPVVLYAAMLAWCALGLAWSRWPLLVQEELIAMGKLALILLVAANALRSRSQLRFFIIFWLACYALFPVRGTYVNYFVAGYSEFGRALWNYMYANSNDLAAMSLLMLGLAAGVAATERRKELRYGALAGVLVLVLLIFLTQSRAGILGLAVFGLLAFVGHRKRGRLIALGLVLALVVGAFAPASVWDRLSGLRNATDVTRLGEVDPEGSAETRFQIWQTALRIIDDHSLTGVGLGTYPLANREYAPLLGRVDTHSTYLNVLAELGAPGLLIFLGLVFGTLLGAERVRRRCRRLLPGAAQQLYYHEIGLLAYMVSGIWGSFSRINFLYVSLILLYALARACESERRALRSMGGTIAAALPGRA